MDFTASLQNVQHMIDENLRKLINDDYSDSNIVKAMSYSLLAGGKRVRPVLSVAICKALGGNMDEILNIGSAIECIHTYSLIHDDLPAMDNDALRRGKPTNHIVFGEANAILAGDGLLNFAFEIIFKEILKNNCDKRFIQAGELISRAAGVIGMIGGQVIDMENEGKQIELDQLYKMHSKKTGALIEAACLSGVYISGNLEALELVKEFSSRIGVAFQIVDDILDYTGDEIVLGKKIGSDKQNGKATFVSLLGIEESKELADKLTIEAKRYAEQIDVSGFLMDFTEYLLKRQN